MRPTTSGGGGGGGEGERVGKWINYVHDTSMSVCHHVCMWEGGGGGKG